MTPFFDRARISALRNLVANCDPAGPACLELLVPERLAGERQMSVLSGSFNPLTTAHLALAEAAEQAELGPVLFALSTRTIDKERVEGAWLEDRLLVLQLHCEGTAERSAALLNRGLYVDQARLFRARLPHLERLVFLVGYDKIVQIFDPRYYEDRRAALDALFSLAEFAVAPRAGAGRRELTALLARSENAAYSPRVHHLDLAPDLADVASSSARQALARGEEPTNLPPETRHLVGATGCYRRGSDYPRRRRAFIDGVEDGEVLQ